MKSVFIAYVYIFAAEKWYGLLNLSPLVFLLLVLLIATISNGLIVRSPATFYKHRHRALLIA